MADTVVVGLSGGVDSSVAAYLLKEQGYNVIGLFMKNWHDESVLISKECPWIEDSHDAMLIAQKLGIPFQVIDLSEQYKERIVDYMFEEYRQGRTPNPDVLCNREIKFDIFLKTAQKLGADYVATGHYCQKEAIQIGNDTVYRLLAGADTNKDQSYFLCQVSQEQLAHALFPIGHLQKAKVREIAREQGLVTADKKDSQGLCFIGKVRLPEFLQQKLLPQKGQIIEIAADNAVEISDGNEWQKAAAIKPYRADDGEIVGEHNGAHYFTIGQRKGLQVGGKPEPLFVLQTNVEENLIFVGQGENHPGLMRRGLKIRESEIHWVRPDLKLGEGETARYQVRIRYRQPLVNAELHKEQGYLYIRFEELQRGIAAGQFAAWYSGSELIGSGVIS